MNKNSTLRNMISAEDELLDLISDEHISTSFDTPLRIDAFEMDDDTKIQLISKHFTQIMDILGLDLTDDSLKDTPKRVAKMYVKEIFSGLNPKLKPKPTLFENHYKYNQMLVERNISVYSNCEHHFVPITGKAHVAYISQGKVIGLSKLNRIVQYYSQRPQVQERLTHQILNSIKETLQPVGVAVVIEASHLCMMMRGVQKQNSVTTTSAFYGEFEKNSTRSEFMKLISSKLH